MRLWRQSVAVVSWWCKPDCATQGNPPKGCLEALLDDDVDDAVHSVEREAVVQSMPQLHGSISGAAGGQGPSNSQP